MVRTVDHTGSAVQHLTPPKEHKVTHYQDILLDTVFLKTVKNQTSFRNTNFESLHRDNFIINRSLSDRARFFQDPPLTLISKTQSLPEYSAPVGNKNWKTGTGKQSLFRKTLHLNSCKQFVSKLFILIMAEERAIQSNYFLQQINPGEATLLIIDAPMQQINHPSFR